MRFIRSGVTFSHIKKSVFFYPPVNGTNTSGYKGAILRTIKAGGCNCSRVNFIGAYFSALKGVDTIPKSWIKKTDSAKKILNQK